MHSISWLLLFAAFGCDTRTSASESHDRGSGDAQRLARVKEREHGVPCSTYAAGSDVHYSEFVLKLETPILAEPEVRLPWIISEDERTSLSGARVLVVPLAMRNTARVPRSPPQGIALLTRDGVEHHMWIYNGWVWSQQHGRRVHWEVDQVRPDEVVRTAFVFDVDPARVEGAVLYLQRAGSVRDRAGHAREVVYEHAIADLYAAVEGGVIRGDQTPGTSRQ